MFSASNLFCEDLLPSILLFDGFMNRGNSLPLEFIFELILHFPFPSVLGISCLMQRLFLVLVLTTSCRVYLSICEWYQVYLWVNFISCTYTFTCVVSIKVYLFISGPIFCLIYIWVNFSTLCSLYIFGTGDLFLVYDVVVHYTCIKMQFLEEDIFFPGYFAFLPLLAYFWWCILYFVWFYVQYFLHLLDVFNPLALHVIFQPQLTFNVYFSCLFHLV